MEDVVVVEEAVVVASSGELVAVTVAGSDGGPDGNESAMVLFSGGGVYDTTVVYKNCVSGQPKTYCLFSFFYFWILLFTGLLLFLPGFFLSCKKKHF